MDRCYVHLLAGRSRTQDRRVHQGLPAVLFQFLCAGLQFWCRLGHCLWIQPALAALQRHHRGSGRRNGHHVLSAPHHQHVHRPDRGVWRRRGFRHYQLRLWKPVWCPRESDPHHGIHWCQGKRRVYEGLYQARHSRPPADRHRTGPQVGSPGCQRLCQEIQAVLQKAPDVFARLHCLYGLLQDFYRRRPEHSDRGRFPDDPLHLFAAHIPHGPGLVLAPRVLFQGIQAAGHGIVRVHSQNGGHGNSPHQCYLRGEPQHCPVHPAPVDLAPDAAHCWYLPFAPPRRVGRRQRASRGGGRRGKAGGGSAHPTGAAGRWKGIHGRRQELSPACARRGQ
mmetsp:Transcript_26693/g.73407  ORF Transcript_26693/g.73407 Transcript_26693/m.73407 type:complete len:335 (-) Transcript_26693:3160-4164(-)